MAHAQRLDADRGFDSQSFRFAASCKSGEPLKQNGTPFQTNFTLSGRVRQGLG